MGTDHTSEDARTEDATERQALARRNLLRLGGLAAAGAAGAVIVGAQASPAGAFSGENLVLGTLNLAEDGTTLTADADLPAGTALLRCSVPAIHAGDFAVLGDANVNGVVGRVHQGGSSGVLGTEFDANDSGRRNGVEGRVANADASSAGVLAVNTGAGIALEATDANVGTGSAIAAHLDTTSNASDVVRIDTAGTGMGLKVSANHNTAIRGTSSDSSGDGVQGHGKAGVRGRYQGTSSGLVNSVGAGVIGESTASGTGVFGATPSGVAVKGLTTNGVGLIGQTTGAANANPAISGVSGGTGPAVRATGKVIPTGTGVAVAGNAAALDVKGRATFSRSGVVTFGGTFAVVDVPGGLTATSHALAMLQTNSGTLAVRAVVPAPSTGKITIYLTGNAASSVTVAWFVFG